MTTDLQTVKSYDAGAVDYSKKLKDSFYHKYIEKPAMYSLLPDVKDKKILCIGCGTGEEIDYLAKLGAKVIGIDISEGMLSVARKNYPNLDFEQMDMTKLDFADGSFDFVYSSLVFHYAENLVELFTGIYRILKNGGQLLFSTTHPIFDSVEILSKNNEEYKIIGHSNNLLDKKVKTYGDYFNEEKRTQDWGNNFVVNFNHKTISTWINDLTLSNFNILKVIEPKPILEAKDEFPSKFEIYSKRPGFIIFFAKKS